MAYFYKCYSKETMIQNGGLVTENPDGTISVFYRGIQQDLVPIPMTKSCCTALDPTYTFDIDNQQCRWSDGEGDTCSNLKPFKVVINPKDNDGAIFSVDEATNEDCILDISFDYLVQLDCKTIVDKLAEDVGLTGDALIKLQGLQTDYEDCLSNLDVYTRQLTDLQEELTGTPYVILCETVNETGELPIGFKPPESKDDIQSPVGLAPNAFPITLTSSYCLTDLGLVQWEQILGTNNYSVWLNSNGTDTSVYGCDEVNQLIALDQSSGTLLGTCTVSYTLRTEIQQQIWDTQATIAGIDCDTILAQITELEASVPCDTVTEILESFDICMTLDYINPDTNLLETLYEESIFNIGAGNLPTYLQDTAPNTGLYSSGETGTTNCEIVCTNLMTELGVALPASGTTEIIDLVQNSLDSSWLHLETSITDETILEQINNEKIKISLKIKDCCVDFSILIDRIKLNKNCSSVTSEETYISKSPGFDMIRVCDNKKSWLSNDDFEQREFDLKLRDTQYNIDNYKLAINSKEMDLDINPANAIEQDLFCYIQDNPCMISPCETGTTNTGITISGLSICNQPDCTSATTATTECCGDNGFDIEDLMSTPLSGITSLKDFKDTMSSELIDVKSWKTLSAHPTLRLVYDRYMNSADYCDAPSSQFDYCDMIQFSELVGTYWVDLIEQVVPSTAIWGSTYVYGNAFWDQQKFKYKKYSLFNCELPSYSKPVPSPTTGWTSDVEVIYETLPNIEFYNDVSGSTTGETYVNMGGCNPDPITNPQTPKNVCYGVGIVQSNCGSEFIGKIFNYGEPEQPLLPPLTSSGTAVDVVIRECGISVETTFTSSQGGYEATANISGSIIGPVSYLWSNGQTTQTAVGLTLGETYTVTVFDNGLEGCSATSNITISLSIGDCAYGGFVFYLDGNGGGLVAAIDDISGSTSVCEKWYFRGDWAYGPTANSSALGLGQDNTNGIIAEYPVPIQDYAAKLAADHTNYDTTCGSYSDWFLPSIDELEIMRVNLASVGDLETDFNFRVIAGCDGANYWSSTVNSATWSWANTMILAGGPFQLQSSTKVAAVRPVRKF